MSRSLIRPSQMFSTLTIALLLILQQASTISEQLHGHALRVRLSRSKPETVADIRAGFRKVSDEKLAGNEECPICYEPLARDRPVVRGANCTDNCAAHLDCLLRHYSIKYDSTDSPDCEDPSAPKCYRCSQNLINVNDNEGDSVGHAQIDSFLPGSVDTSVEDDAAVARALAAEGEDTTNTVFATKKFNFVLDICVI